MSDAEMMSPLAQRIDERKRAVGIRTNVELSQLSGVGRAVITNINKNPTKSIMATSAIELSKALQCRVEWLIYGTGPISEESALKFAKLKIGTSVVRLEELAGQELIEFAKAANAEEDREKITCPTGSTESTIAIRLNRTIGKYLSGGIIFFDVSELNPSTGQTVLAETAPGVPPEVMEFTFAHGRKFLKSLSEDIPTELRFIEMSNDMKILATYKSYALL